MPLRSGYPLSPSVGVKRGAVRQRRESAQLLVLLPDYSVPPKLPAPATPSGRQAVSEPPSRQLHFLRKAASEAVLATNRGTPSRSEPAAYSPVRPQDLLRHLHRQPSPNGRSHEHSPGEHAVAMKAFTPDDEAKFVPPSSKQVPSEAAAADDDSGAVMATHAGLRLELTHCRQKVPTAAMVCKCGRMLDARSVSCLICGLHRRKALMCVVCPCGEICSPTLLNCQKCEIPLQRPVVTHRAASQTSSRRQSDSNLVSPVAIRGQRQAGTPLSQDRTQLASHRSHAPSAVSVGVGRMSEVRLKKPPPKCQDAAGELRELATRLQGLHTGTSSPSTSSKRRLQRPGVTELSDETINSGRGPVRSPTTSPPGSVRSGAMLATPRRQLFTSALKTTLSPAQAASPSSPTQRKKAMLTVPGENATAPARQPSRGSTSPRKRTKLGASLGESGKQHRSSTEIRTLRLHSIFQRLQDADKELHRDLLGKALSLLQIIVQEGADEDIIKGVYDENFKYSTLDIDEFVRFVQAFEERQEKEGAKLFAQVDANGSGLLDVEELMTLLASMGFTPMRHILEGIAREVSQHTGRLEDVELNYHDFKKVVTILRAREGFLQEDVDDFQNVFGLFDHSDTGELSTGQLMSALSYLGYGLEKPAVEAIVKEVDLDKSGKVCFSEFLVCMRKVREREIARIKKLLDSQSTAPNAVVDRLISGRSNALVMLDGILHSLGYFPNEKAVADAVQDAGLRTMARTATAFTFEQVWRILEVYRRRDGMTREDVEETERIFANYDANHNGVMDASEVGAMLRDLGYVCSFAMIRKMIAEVDVNGSGDIDLAEFKKLIRILQRQRAQKVKAIFDMKANLKGFLAKQKCVPTLEAAGMPETAIANVFARKSPQGQGKSPSGDSTEYNFSNFADLAGQVEATARDQVKKTYGFDDAAVVQFREEFASYNRKGNGEIKGAELRMLLQDRFSSVASGVDTRPLLVQLVEEVVESDGSGTLSFDKFLRLMRACENLRESSMSAAETAAVRETGFSREEVADFRQLFLGGTERCHVFFEELQQMLAETIPLGSKNSVLLKERFDANVSSPGHMTFGEFLRLMRTLMDENFAGISSLKPTSSPPPSPSRARSTCMSSQAATSLPPSLQPSPTGHSKHVSFW
eukprot:TRINITY_DN58877_c0_g1_i1.p1 TRINITY_DN58877_c0_g1~~TRINITY_DN58877_c0_g1_i1.p1  ORF type:complete len:1150 (+),score=198.43 TRINITY_DN58877_c0_g1_i1:193-3642(+)